MPENKQAHRINIHFNPKETLVYHVKCSCGWKADIPNSPAYRGEQWEEEMERQIRTHAEDAPARAWAEAHGGVNETL